MSLIDITVSISHHLPVWPGDPAVILKTLTTLENASCHLSSISMSLHTGTHIDAPKHYIENGLSLDQVPLESLIGRTRVIEIPYSQSISAKDFKTLNFNEGERILLKTRNSEVEWWRQPFNEEYVYLLPEAAQILVDSGIQCVGIDYLSIGDMGKSGIKTHQLLLEAGIWIIEGLDLSQVMPGEYELMALPLKITNSEGAPARVLLKTLLT